MLREPAKAHERHSRGSCYAESAEAGAQNEIRGHDSLRSLPKPKPAQRFGWLCELPQVRRVKEINLYCFSLTGRSLSPKRRAVGKEL